MYPSRMQELLSTVRSKFSSTGAAAEKDDSQEIGELAEQIMEFGRMIHNDSPQQRIFVNVTEVGRRFREDRQRVIKALVLLRRQGRADRTARREDWKLHVQLTEREEFG
jgi:hypothetical protein